MSSPKLDKSLTPYQSEANQQFAHTILSALALGLNVIIRGNDEDDLLYNAVIMEPGMSCPPLTRAHNLEKLLSRG